MKNLNCTFYRPEQVNSKEFTNIVEKMERDLDILINDQVKGKCIEQYVYDLLRQAKPLKRNPEMYFLGLDEPGTMPSDIRVLYFYRPTYIGAAFIIRSVLLYPELLDSMPDFYGKNEPAAKESVRTVLSRLLLGCTGRGFSGHGYDGLEGLIDTLTIFTKAGSREFVAIYPDVCKKFSELYTSSICKIEELVEKNMVRNEWGDDYSKEAQRLLKLYHEKDSITDDRKNAQKKIHEDINISSESAGDELVWYACYGSNLSSTRFQEYLDACSGNVEKTENKAYETTGTLYFAEDSEKWGRGHGVAFFDEMGEGTVLMRIYRITRNQFHAVQSMEGPKYSRGIELGMVDGIPVYTFTASRDMEFLGAPSVDYVKTIMTGLKETYPAVSDAVLLSYIIKYGGISDAAREVLTYIRKAPHAVTLREITERIDLPGTSGTDDSVRSLLSFGLIKQDSRSRRAGHSVEDPDAMFFTAPEKRDITDQIVYGVI